MKHALAIMSLLLLSGCYLSGNRGHRLTSDTISHPDAPADTLTDADTTEPDVEVPDTACLYEPTGARQLSDEGHAVEAPEVYWNGTHVGVVSFEGGGDIPVHSYVSLTNVAADLSWHSERRLIGEESHGWGEPAWTGEAMGLCWHSDPGYVSRTGFRLHDRDGGAIGTRVDLDLEGEACLDLEYGAGHYLAAWRHHAESSIDTRLQILDDGGIPIGEPMDVANGEYPGTAPAVEWTGREFLVAVPRPSRIDLMWISPDGSSIGGTILEVEEAAYCELAYNDSRIAIAWSSGPRWERGLYFQVFEPEEVVAVGERMLLEEVGIGVRHPEVHVAPDGWVVSWHVESEELNHARLLHTDPEGVPREPRISLHEGHNSTYGGPSLVHVGDDLFVGISHYRDETPGLDQMYLLKYTCVDGEMDVCAEQDAEVNSLDICEEPIHFGWKWDGSTCLEVEGCSCNGEDCDGLARSRWDCLSDRWHCG